MHRTLVLAAAGLALGGSAAVVAPAAAQQPTYTIRVKGAHVTALGDWRALRNPTIGDATAVFGAPAAREPLGDTSCAVRWTAPRLRVVFADFGAAPGDPCSDTRGKAQTFTTRDGAFATTRGLRPGMAGRQVFKRHPKTEPHRNSYWLYKATVPGTSRASGILRLTFTQDLQRIARFKGYIGAAGE